MKLVLSRKGFDSQYGGGDSPVLPGGRLLSLPIPSEDATCYRDVGTGSRWGTMADIIESLYGPGRLPKIGGHCHLDPDLDSAARRRPPSWRGVLGQMGAAQGHLRRQGVGPGDLFLFFGRFRDTREQGRRLQFVPGSVPAHILFGYLQVGEVIGLNTDRRVPRWLHYHPHVQARESAGENNTLYLAAERLSLDERLPGWGVFNDHPLLRLTVPDSTRISDWALPQEIFGRTAISYHSPANWRGHYFRAAARGQEFVMHADRRIRPWALDVIRRGLGPRRAKSGSTLRG